MPLCVIGYIILCPNKGTLFNERVTTSGILDIDLVS